MAELLAELSGESGRTERGVRSRADLRPYRDLRFQAGKPPYETEIYATLERGG